MKRALWVLALLCACDDSPARVQHAKAQYQALIDQRADATDPRFDGVLAELAKVKPDESAHAEADRLRHAILAARGPLLRAPLATGAHTGDAELDALKLRCARLAAEAGPLSGEAREAKLKEIETCQHDVTALDLKKAHELEGADAGG